MNYRGHYNIYTDIFFDDSGKRNYYINRGFGEVEAVSSGLLQNRLSNFPEGFNPQIEIEVLGILDKMKKRNRNFWWVVGATAASIGLSALFIDQSRETLDREANQGLRNVGLGFAGLGLGGFVTFIVMPKSRKLNLKALHTYNSGF